MSIIGQPQSYSDMLKRIFAATLAVGVLCTLGVAAVSPSVRSFLESWDAKTSIGILPPVKALYVLIPLIAAILARVFLLHDRISDLFRIRRGFDIEHILKPLAEGVGFGTVGEKWKRIENNRKLAMTRTFYRYAGFANPKIDMQLVRTAADRWAWFWSTLEPAAILLIAGPIFAVLRAWLQFWIVLASTAVLILIALLLWPQLRKGARSQVDEILTNGDWKEDVRCAFDGVSGVVSAATQQGGAPEGGTHGS